LTVSNADRELDFSLQLKESPRAAGAGGSTDTGAGKQNRNQLESQIQSELENNQASQVSPMESVDDSNDAFLVSGTLSKGPSPSVAPNSSPLAPGFGDQPGSQSAGLGTPNINAPGFGISGRKSKRSGGRGNAAPRRSGNRRQASQIHGTLSVRFENSALNG